VINREEHDRMSTQQGAYKAPGSGGSETAGTAKDEAAQTAQTAKDQAAQTAQTAKDQSAQTAQTAQREAAHVGAEAVSAASDVAGTAKEQVTNVAGEAMDQVRDLTGQVRSQFAEQAGAAAEKLAQAVRSLAEELQEMSEHQGRKGAATQAARQLAERGRSLADYLENREPESLVSDLRGSAARRPGGFLLGALVAGALTGRLVRSGRAASDSSPSSRTGVPGVTGEYVPVPASPGYEPAHVTGQPGYTAPTPVERPYADVYRTGTEATDFDTRTAFPRSTDTELR